ncbi:MAG: hypothetical protein KQ78_01562 [Candidatus Izimaplasma bacterium HR2]|nr:MAG: hypothetical protein KQ78_01562 [Candidatus Izimaplasma bacterium HR2]
MRTETIYFYHIDELRDENKIKIEEFIEGICSIRQYWRYRNGDNVCTQKKITLFLEKLNLSHSEFFNYFYAKELSEYKRLAKLYSLININKKNEAKEIITSLNNINFVSIETRSLFSLYKLLYENEFSNSSLQHKINNYAKAIDYPKCLERTFYSFRDLVLLIRIAKYESKCNIFKATERLYEIIKTDIVYVSGHTRFFMPSIFVSLSKIYGSSGDFTKSLDISNEGIEYSKRIQDSRALPNLYYSSAISKYKLGIRNQYEDDIIKCLFSSIASHSKETYNLYVNLIKNTFGITDEILINMISSYLILHK